MNASAAELQSLINRGEIKGERNIEFATSLLRSASSKRGASFEQQKWIAKLVERAKQPKPEPITTQLTSDVRRIFVLFEAASANGLKWPKIHLTAADGQAVVFSRAGERSQYVGQVMITDGQPYGVNKFFGRITTDGQLVQGRAMSEFVKLLIERFAFDPAYMAAEYGKKTGACCFCSRKLDTVESTAVGYGPICAKKFNLPWGEKATLTVAVLSERAEIEVEAMENAL